MSKSLLQQFRSFHRKIASVLFIFFLCISITAILLGWKAAFTKTIFENKKQIVSTTFKQWLPIDSLELLATAFLNEKTNNHFIHSERVEVRLAKGYINFGFKNNFNIQLDGATGQPVLIEQKNGGLIQDIHDGAFVDGLVGSKSGLSKKIYSSIMGLALLMLTLTGIYLWLKPKQIKKQKTKQ